MRYVEPFDEAPQLRAGIQSVLESQDAVPARVLDATGPTNQGYLCKM